MFNWQINYVKGSFPIAKFVLLPQGVLDVPNKGTLHVPMIFHIHRPSPLQNLAGAAGSLVRTMVLRTALYDLEGMGNG